MTNKERKEKGMVYCYDDPALLGDQHIYQNKMLEYNHTLPTETEKRQKLLPLVFAEIGEGCTVETPFGAGSVVTSDIPSDVVAYGVPYRVVCYIGEKDEKFYYKDKESDVWE